MLEGETGRTVVTQMELFHERALPDLDDNIKCGNSLVGTAFQTSQGMLIDEETQRKVNAFDWDNEFPRVARGRGFDVIVGNPPWLMAGYYVAESVPYLKENYLSATGKFDLYYVFVEQSLRLLARDGTLGVIIPNKFFHTRAARALRLLLSKVGLGVVKDFGIAKVFERATNYSCILLAGKGVLSDRVDYVQVDEKLREAERFSVARAELTGDPWVFEDRVAKEFFAKLNSMGTPLSQLVDRFATGVQSGSDRLLMFTPTEALDEGIEPDILATILRGRDVRAYRIGDAPKKLLFPDDRSGSGFRIFSADEMATLYPKAWQYLRFNRRALESRAVVLANPQ